MFNLKHKSLLITLSFLMFAYSANAHSFLKSKTGSICEQANAAGIEPIRKTIVYVDKGMLSLDQNEQGWLNTLYQVLQQTMSSAEPLDIVIIDGSDGSAKMHGQTLCYPFVDEKFNDRFQSRILRNNLLDEIPSFQRDIIRDIQDNLRDAYTGVPNNFSIRSATNYPQKHFLRALQSDSARLIEDLPVRVIIFSDFIENSDLISLETIISSQNATDTIHQASTVLNSLPRLDFQSAMIYGFGAGSSLDNPSISDQISQFSRQLIYLANGHPVDINRELGTRPVRPSNLYIYDSIISVNERDIRGRMTLLTDNTGRVVDSYMDLGVDGRSAHFDRGRLVCSANNACQLEGLLASALLFEDPENVYLEGDLNNLSGFIGFRNDVLVDSENAALVPVKFTLRNN